MNIPAAPYFMYDVTVKLGADTYEEALTSVKFTPTTPKVTFKGLAKNSKTFVGTPTWVSALTFAQDLASAASLHKLLHSTAPGTPIVLELIATETGEKVRATILVEPGELGGDVETVPTSAVTLAVDGPVERIAIA